MDIQELWDKALRRTEIVRSRALELSSVETTVLPYVFLAESNVNTDDTVVRTGRVLVERPALILPTPRLEGFEFDHDWQLSDDSVVNFLLVRGVRFPSMRYQHECSSLDLREGSLRQAIDDYTERLARSEDIQTGLLVGPEDAWQFSILILVGSLVIRSAEGDLRRIMESWKRKQA